MLMLAGCLFQTEAGYAAKAIVTIQESLNRCIAAGLGYRRSESGERLFDPAEVMHFLIWAGQADLDDFWINQLVSNGRALVTELGESTNNRTRFRINYRRTFDLRPLQDAAARVRLRMPLPLRGSHVGELLVIPDVAPELAPEVRISDGRLEARVLAPLDGAVTIGATVEFGAPSEISINGAGRLEPDEADLYLRPIEGPIRVTPRILDLARRLAGTLSADGGPLATANRFWDYMIYDLSSGTVRYDEAPGAASGDWILESGRYDCQLGAALFASLCRASGIPARLVSGHFLYRLAPLPHFWCEIWIDGRGWLTFDFLAWGLSEGGRDQAWKDRFAGRRQPHAITQCFPRNFTGPMSVHFPPAWQMLQTRAGNGVDVTYTDISDGSLIYTDHMELEPPISSNEERPAP
jgi:hypothetical protein